MCVFEFVCIYACMFVCILIRHVRLLRRCQLRIPIYLVYVFPMTAISYPWYAKIYVHVARTVFVCACIYHKCVYVSQTVGMYGNMYACMTTLIALYVCKAM